MKYEEMKPCDIEKVLKEKPIAYIPWGAHEWHGPQNPLGLDTLKCYHQCLALCQETGGIVVPPVYCGYQTMKPHMGFPYTLEFDKDTVTSLAFQYLTQLYEEGFRVLIIVMGHYGGKHLEAIQQGVELFKERHSSPVVWAFPDYEPTQDEGIYGDHAGINETSLMMHFRPDLVDLSLLPEKIDSTTGAGANAVEATAENGKKIMAVFVKNAVPKILDLLKQAHENYKLRYKKV